MTLDDTYLKLQTLFESITHPCQIPMAQAYAERLAEDQDSFISEFIFEQVINQHVFNTHRRLTL